MLDDAYRLAVVISICVGGLVTFAGWCWWMGAMWKTVRDTHGTVTKLDKWSQGQTMHGIKVDGRLDTHDKRLDKHEEWIGEIRDSEVFRKGKA